MKRHIEVGNVDNGNVARGNINQNIFYNNFNENKSPPGREHNKEKESLVKQGLLS